MVEVNGDHLARAVGIAPLLQGHRPGGETPETLDTLAECADKAARDVREHPELASDRRLARLLHVAEHDVPRLLYEIQRLSG